MKFFSKHYPENWEVCIVRQVSVDRHEAWVSPPADDRCRIEEGRCLILLDLDHRHVAVRCVKGVKDLSFADEIHNRGNGQIAKGSVVILQRHAENREVAYGFATMAEYRQALDVLDTRWWDQNIDEVVLVPALVQAPIARALEPHLERVRVIETGKGPLITPKVDLREIEEKLAASVKALGRRSKYSAKNHH